MNKQNLQKHVMKFVKTAQLYFAKDALQQD